ncbi:hypothetical protein KP509_1Z132100 [Ceratopteris richardii]|nr:hypothetical protein KP509_1Z132100 [Ceratopteris richardii]
MGEGVECPDRGRRGEKEALDHRELNERSTHNTSSSSPSADNLLERICRLDAILVKMEEVAMPDRFTALQSKSIPTREHSSAPATPLSSNAPATPLSLNEHRRPTEYVLEEVQRKGTLVERVSDLEERFLQLQRAVSTRSRENSVYSNESEQQSLKDIVNLEQHEVVFSHVSVGLVKGVEKKETVLESSEDLHVNNEIGAGCKLAAAEEQRYGECPPATPPPPRKKRHAKLAKWISNHFRVLFRETSQVEGFQ